MRMFIAMVLSLALGTQTFATPLQTSAGEISVTKIVGGLNQPWAIGFLPGGRFLVTLRGGALLNIGASGQIWQVSGIPKVAARGQGGLLDVMIPRDFAQSREVFLSFAKPQGQEAGTALGVGRLSSDGRRLIGFHLLFEMQTGTSGKRHFGGRIVEGRDRAIYMSIGERGDRPSAQDLSRHNGSIIRINRNGTVPRDNPFVGQGGLRPEIWSYGHRNPQGMALDQHGQLWAHEHGAQGGDEVNMIRKGANYGWPVIAYGRHYSGAKIGEGTAKAGMEQPEMFWDPSIAPSGMMIYSGKLWPAWRGDIFVGSLKFDYIARLDPDHGFDEEKLQTNQMIRVRDVRESPDGSIWFLSVGKGAVFKMTPQ